MGIDGYYVERRDRNQFGGGVAMYIHNSVEYKIRDDLMNSEIECLTIQGKIGMSKPFLVTSLYSPHNNTDHLNRIDSLIACIDTENVESIMIGDTNCYFIKQTNYTTHLKRIIKNHALPQLIEDPTRTTDSTTTLIDHLITNKPDIVGQSGVIPCGISDHDLIFMTRKARLPKLKIPPRVVNAHNHKKFDLKAFHLDIQHIPFDIIKTVSKDVNDIWLRWKTFFLDILEKHMPTTEFRLNANKIPYINAQAKQLIRQRDYLRAKANKTDSNILRQAYNHIRNKVNSTLRKLRKNYYTKRIQINEGNLKNTWKVLKEAIGQNDKTCSIDKIVIDDTNQTDKAKIADAFNNHFVSIGEKIANSTEGCNESPIANIRRVPTKFEFQQITAAQIQKLLKDLSMGKLQVYIIHQIKY